MNPQLFASTSAQGTLSKHTNSVAGIALAVWLFAIVGCTDENAVVAHLGSLNEHARDSLDLESGFRDEPIRPLIDSKGPLPQKVMLGKLLFHDVRLSKNNTISCSSCHNISEGGDDGRPVSIGINGRKGKLNAPTVFNCSLSTAQFWDGRANNLYEQTPQPIHNPTEMGSNWNEVIQKLNKDESLRIQFQNVFGQPINRKTIVEAIVSYENALITVDSPFDRYLRGDDNAISGSARQGYKLFKSVGCISCHQGRTVGGNMFQEFGILGDFSDRFEESTEFNKGRFNVTKRKVDLHRFKVPSLRNIEQTAPYFHTGDVQELSEAIEIMAEHQLGESLQPKETERIEAFLKSLTGSIREELQ